MAYYIAGIISIFITIVIQISMVQFIQITSIIPNLLVIPLVFFSIGLRPRFEFGAGYLFGPKSFQSRQASAGLSDELSIFRDKGSSPSLEKYFENIFRGAFFGFIAGFSNGITSQLFWADVFSWTSVGFFLGLIAGPVNRENPAIRSLLLFLATFLQGTLFFIPLYILLLIPFPSLFFQRLLFGSLYTVLLGTFILRLAEKKRKEGIIRYGD
jgi:hypothetical protein